MRKLPAVLLALAAALAALSAHAGVAPPAAPSSMDDLPPSLTNKGPGELVGILHSAEPMHRAAAAAEVGRRRLTSAVPDLRALLSDQHDFVRIRAAAALADLGDPSGLPALRQLLQTSVLTFDAAEELAKRGDGLARSIVRLALDSRSAATRRRALLVLGSAADDSSYAILRVGLADTDRLTREIAIGLAEKKRTTQGVALLTPLLSDADPKVRWRGAVALARTGCADTVPLLIRALGDADELVRRCAALNLIDLTGRSPAGGGVSTAAAAAELQSGWRAWWEANKAKFPPGMKLPASAAPTPPAGAGSTGTK